MKKLIQKYDIAILLTILVISLSSLSWYNYYTQKNLLLEQMKSDSNDIVNSITAAMNKFYNIKTTINIQRLVSDISLNLEIFEFRYLDSSGVIRNSMFESEIGTIHKAESFAKTMQGDIPLGEFFFEVHDFVPVMVIYYPLSLNNDLIGIIDFSIDISEYSYVSDINKDFVLSRRQVDILNLLKAIKGSIFNTISISQNINLHDFLHNYVNSAENILEISLIDNKGVVTTSSHKEKIGTVVDIHTMPSSSTLVEIGEKLVYRIVTDKIYFSNKTDMQLSLVVDASPFANNRDRLLRNSITNSTIALIFALVIAYVIFRSAIRRSESEKLRLERLVKERTADIELLSKTDALTGLWNRGYLEEMSNMEFKRARRYNHNIYVLLIDLDYFKKVNDTYGHLAGDEVLREISKRIKNSIRETDFISRYGGEEIVVILTETSAKEAKQISEKILKIVAEKPVKFENIEIPITASIGLSSLNKNHDSYKDIFKEADEALYASKSSGRNRATCYSNLPSKLI